MTVGSPRGLKCTSFQPSSLSQRFDDPNRIRAERSRSRVAVIGASTAHAQQAVQAFEDKYGPPRTSANIVQLPTFGIGPAGTTTLDANVAEELTEVIQREMAVAQEMRFEISARSPTASVRE